MKKYFMLFAAAATVLAVSCNKGNNGATETPDVPPVVTEEEDNTPVPIEFGTKAAEVKAPTTKAAIDNWNNVGNEEKIYVYGLERTSDVVTTYSSVYINNVAADAPNEAVVGLDKRTPINVYDPAVTTSQTPFYYVDNKYYDFYAYFVADAADNDPTPTVDAAENPTTITLGVEINGTQDIMLATTDKASDEGYRTDRSKAVPERMMYSAKSARRGVVPNLNFEHQLSRFVFNIKAANETVANGQAPNAEPANLKGKVTIQGVKMESFKKGTLTIVGANRGLEPTASTEEANNIEYLTVTGPDGGFQFNADINQYSTYGEIMVYPTSTDALPNVYNFKILMTQEGAAYTAEHPYELPLEIKFAENETALAGKKYEVKVIVYGLEEVQITVSLKEWDDGNTFDLDPDDNGENPVQISNLGITLDPSGNVVIGTDATIGLDWSNVSVTEGDTPDATAQEALAATLYCTSSDTSKARVYKDNDGWKVKGVAAGTATITVSVGNKHFYGTATQPITVQEPENP